MDKLTYWDIVNRLNDGQAGFWTVCGDRAQEATDAVCAAGFASVVFGEAADRLRELVESYGCTVKWY